MKVAVIIDLWPPIIGGSQTHVWELSSRLIQNYNCKVDIFTRALIGFDNIVYDQNEVYFNGRLKIFRISPAMKYSNIPGRVATIFTIANKVISKHKREKYNLIHAHSILGGLIGRITKIFIGKPLLFTVHGSPNLGGGRKDLDCFIEKLIHTKIRYDRVISVGKGFLKYRNINRNIEVIPNGVDIEKFDFIRNIPKAGFFKIIFVGRLDWTKGVDTLIKAVKLLKEKHYSLINKMKVQIHIIGYGFDIEKYKTMVNNYGLNELIIFRGKITGDELIKEYKSSTLFILPSVTEGDSMVIKEAWAAKIPVLATRCNAPEYYIKDQVDGFLVDKNSSRQLVEAILSILYLPHNRLVRMGAAGYENVKENNRWDSIVGKTFDIYRSLQCQ